MLLPAFAGAGLITATAPQLSAQNPATTVTVDATANQRPINPNIYGVGGSVAQADVTALNAPLNRIGGNPTSTYNWLLDATNKGSDWYFESYASTNEPATPGASYDSTIQGTRNANVGSEPMVTIPMLPFIATVQANATPSAASLWSYSVAKYGPHVACGSLGTNDPWQTDAGSGCLTSNTYVVNNPLDAYIPNSVATQEAFIQHLISKWGPSTSPTGIKYYVLDNEPSIWSSTHRDVNPTPVDYDQEYNNIVNYATAIRSLDPNVKIIGPEEWIWWAMWESGKDQNGGIGASSDYATHNNTYYYPYLLQKLYAYQQSSGVKMLDVLTVHCYTDASSTTNYNAVTRELWDPNYVDPDWEGTLGLNGGVLEWIPLMKQWVSQYYPGLQVGCTEYNWGNQTTLTGATTQADAEGIYGAYGLDMATIWTAPPYPTYLAMQMYRNYDGNLSIFGDTSVSDTVANPDNLSSYAAVRTSDGALTVMVINKQTGTTPVTIDLSDFSNAGTATAYQINSATQTSIANLGSVPVTKSAINFTAPAQSVTLFVIPAAPAGSPTFTSTASATPNAIPLTGSTNIAFSLTDPGAAVTNATVEVQIYNASNTLVGSQTFTGQNFTSGGTNPYTYTWTPSAQTPAVTAGGKYSVQVGVFDSTENTNYYWNLNAATVTLTLPPTPAPTFSLAGGSYTTAQSLKITDSASNATIYYTTNGTTPTTSSAVYGGTIAVTGTETVQAIAVAPGDAPSTVTSVSYTIPPAFTDSTTVSPATISASGTATITANVTDTGGALTNGNVDIQIFNASGTNQTTCAPSGQNFTAGGTNTYTCSWTPAAGTAPGTYTVTVGVFNSAWSTDYSWDSNAATITISSTQVATPAFTPVAGTYTSTQNVTITDATPNSTIYYTTDGSAPTTGSAKYTTAISVGATETINAIAVASGLTQSGVGTAAYTINNAIPVLSSTAVPNPSSITAAGSTIITATVKNTGSTASQIAGNIEVYVYNSSNSQVAAGVCNNVTYSTTTPATCSYTWTPGTAPAGTYTVIVGAFNSSWSLLNWSNGIATINVISKATATVNLSNLSQTYTGLPLSAVVTTIPAGLSVNLTYNGSSTAPAAVGSYTVAATVNDPNYTGSSNGLLSINPAMLTVTANSISQAPGTTPALTYTITGYSTAVPQPAVTGAPVLTTTATSSSPVGSYPITITQGTLAVANYTLTFVNGTYSVVAAPAVVLTTTATLSKVTGGYQAIVTVTNSGTASAPNVQLTSATLGTPVGSPLPQNLGTIAPGASAQATILFPASAGADGAAAVDKYAGTYTGGTFGSSIRTVLP